MNHTKILLSVTVSGSWSMFAAIIPKLIDKYDVHLMSSPGERLDEMKVKYGISAHPIFMNRKISIIQDIKSLFEIYRLMKKEKFSMVHSMSPKAGLLNMLAAKWAKIPVRVHTFTGLVWPSKSGLLRFVLKNTDRITCSCATHIIPESQGVMNDLALITKKKMHVLGYGNIKGVDLELFNCKNVGQDEVNKIRRNTSFIFIYAGRIVKDKGIDELLDAFIRIEKEFPHTKLLLLGSRDSNLDPISPHAAGIIDSHDNIEEKGHQPIDVLINHYAASNCLVLPSYREGFPNTVLEGCAMGLPAIVTDINGSREVIQNEFNGLIVPPKDTNALYLAMKRMIVDDDARLRMASNARSRIEERYERGFVCDCLMNYYKEILS